LDTQENAQKAIDKLNGSKLGDKDIEVMIHAKKEERKNDQGEIFTNLYITNLPTENFSADKLKEIFEKYGAVESVSLNANKPGSGFVSFKEHTKAKEALDATNMKEKINGTAILVMPHVYKKDNDLYGKPKQGMLNPIAKN